MENEGVKANVCRDSWDGEGTSDRVCKGIVTTGDRDCQSHREDCKGGQGRENPTANFFSRYYFLPQIKSKPSST